MPFKYKSPTHIEQVLKSDLNNFEFNDGKINLPLIGEVIQCAVGSPLFIDNIIHFIEKYRNRVVEKLIDNGVDELQANVQWCYEVDWAMEDAIATSSAFAIGLGLNQMIDEDLDSLRNILKVIEKGELNKVVDEAKKVITLSTELHKKIIETLAHSKGLWDFILRHDFTMFDKVSYETLLALAGTLVTSYNEPSGDDDYMTFIKACKDFVAGNKDYTSSVDNVMKMFQNGVYMRNIRTRVVASTKLEIEVTTKALSCFKQVLNECKVTSYHNFIIEHFIDKSLKCLEGASAELEKLVNTKKRVLRSEVENHVHMYIADCYCWMQKAFTVIGEVL